MSQTVELSDNVWSNLQQAAKANGVTAADWIAANLTAPAKVDGPSAPVEDEDANDLEPATYTSVPLERVGTVQVMCVAGRDLPPLPYPLEDPSE